METKAAKVRTALEGNFLVITPRWALSSILAIANESVRDD